MCGLKRVTCIVWLFRCTTETFRCMVYTYTHLTAFCPGLTGFVRYQNGKTNLNFTEAKDSEWLWHQLGHMQVCTSLQTDNHTSTPPLSFFTGQMPFVSPIVLIDQRVWLVWVTTSLWLFNTIRDCLSIILWFVMYKPKTKTSYALHRVASRHFCGVFHGFAATLP